MIYMSSTCWVWLKFVKLEEPLKSTHRKELKCIDNIIKVSSSKYMLGTVLSTLPASSHLVPTTVLKSTSTIIIPILQMKKTET